LTKGQKILANEDLGLFSQLIEQYQHEHNVPAVEVAAALAQLLQGDTPFLLQHKPQRKADDSWNKAETKPHEKYARPSRKQAAPAEGMQRYRLNFVQ